MGSLLPIMIRTDRLDDILKNPEKFAKELELLANEQVSRDVIINDHIVAIAHTSRHYSDSSTYVNLGNTSVEMNPYKEETLRLLREDPKFYDKVVKFMQKEVTELKKLRKNYEK